LKNKVPLGRGLSPPILNSNINELKTRFTEKNCLPKKQGYVACGIMNSSHIPQTTEQTAKNN